MKSTEYVTIVTKLYRKFLDLYAKYDKYTVLKSDLEDLNQIYNRGGFTKGYLFENPGKDLMSGELPKHQGILIGKVGGKTNKNGLIKINLEK
ncbi:U32 family peptidase [Anaerovorax odorimutans]|uniref:U32 family peptidase n=1 Tax=Anaerovorax odorimutans TaxID=109327 RepID=UPI0004187695|nr:U32 family peptidase [Anaerovorax odorimutans]